RSRRPWTAAACGPTVDRTATERRESRAMFLPRRFHLVLAAALLVLVGATYAHAAATITIVDVDGAGSGLNDATPVAPVGGNPGTTLGAQRLNAMEYAADVWGAVVNSAIE